MGTALVILLALAGPPEVTLRLRDGSTLTGELDCVRDGRYWLRAGTQVHPVPVDEVLEVVLPPPGPPEPQESPPPAPLRRQRPALPQAALEAVRSARRIDLAARALREGLTTSTAEERTIFTEAALARMTQAIYQAPAHEETEWLLQEFTAALANHPEAWRDSSTRLRQLWNAWLRRLDRAGASRMRPRAILAQGRFFPDSIPHRVRTDRGPELAYIRELIRAGLRLEARQEIEALLSGQPAALRGVAAASHEPPPPPRFEEEEVREILSLLREFASALAEPHLRQWASETAWAVARRAADGAPPDRSAAILNAFLAGDPAEPWRSHALERLERVAEAAALAVFQQRVERGSPQEAVIALRDYLAAARDVSNRALATDRAWGVIGRGLEGNPAEARRTIEAFLALSPEEPWRSRAERALEHLGRDEEFDRLRQRLAQADPDQALELMALLLNRTEDPAKRWMVCGRVWQILEPALATQPPLRARDLLLRYSAMGPAEPWRSYAVAQLAALARSADRETLRVQVESAQPAEALALLRGYLAETADETDRRWAFRTGWQIVAGALTTAPPRVAAELLETYLALGPQEPWEGQARAELTRVREHLEFEDLRRRVVAADPEVALTLLEGFVAREVREDRRRWAFDAAWSVVERSLMTSHETARPLLDRFLRMKPPEPWLDRARRWLEALESARPQSSGAPAGEEPRAQIGQGAPESAAIPPGVSDFMPLRPGSWYEYRVVGTERRVRVEYREPLEVAPGMVRVTQVASGAASTFLYVSAERIEQEVDGRRTPLLVAPLREGQRWPLAQSDPEGAYRQLVRAGGSVSLSSGRVFDDCVVVETVTTLALRPGAPPTLVRSRATYARGIGLVRMEWLEGAPDGDLLELQEWSIPRL